MLQIAITSICGTNIKKIESLSKEMEDRKKVKKYKIQ
jgi:hypothetical protein